VILDTTHLPSIGVGDSLVYRLFQEGIGSAAHGQALAGILVEGRGRNAFFFIVDEAISTSASVESQPQWGNRSDVATVFHWKWKKKVVRRLQIGYRPGRRRPLHRRSHEKQLLTCNGEGDCPSNRPVCLHSSNAIASNAKDFVSVLCHMTSALVDLMVLSLAPLGLVTF